MRPFELLIPCEDPNMSFWKWSRVAASNATADSTINWAEGQAPSSVNDSARALMAAAAKYRDDSAGVLVTAGSATAYTLASFQSFDTLAHMDGAHLVIVPHVTCGAAPTLNVDGLGGKPINISTGVAVPAGFLLANCPYQLTYYNATSEFIIHNCFGVLPSLGGSSLQLVNLIVSGVLTLTGTGYAVLPAGTTAQRPGSPAAGQFRYNTDLTNVEFYDGGAWRAPAFAQPIAAGFKNLLIANNAGTPDSKIDVSADAATLETASFIAYRKSQVAVTINCTTTGANGLDSGSLAANTWYYLWLIYNPATDTVAGLASISSSAPTMPSGYTAKARLGATRTGGAATFNRVRQLGRQAQYVVTPGTPTPNLPIAASGTTSGTISLANFVPATASAVQFVLSGNMGPSAANSITDSVAPNGNYGAAGSTGNPPTGGYSIFGSNSGNEGISLSLRMQLEAPSFVRSATTVGGSLAVAVAGWEDNI
jgi:hypothetical protein